LWITPQTYANLQIVVSLTTVQRGSGAPDRNYATAVVAEISRG
jgi:hypothetical protein